MRTLTASHRAVVAGAVGVVLSLSLVACSGTVTPYDVGCSLEQFHGDLVAENGRPVFRSIQHNLPPDPVPLDLPGGWEIRAADGGQFEILDGTGAVQVTTGTRVILLTRTGNSPHLNPGAPFAVCSASPYRPMEMDVEDAP